MTIDVDTIYHGFESVLPNVDYLVASSEFPAAWTGESDPFRALTMIQQEYGMKVAAMTLGAHGALALARRAIRLGGCFDRSMLQTAKACDHQAIRLAGERRR